MKKFIKKMLKKIIKENFFVKHIELIKINYNKHKRVTNSKNENIKYFIKECLKMKSYPSKKTYKLIKSIDVEIDSENHFIYFIDTMKQIRKIDRIIGNITIDYNRLLTNSLKDLENTNSQKIIEAIKYLVGKTEKEIDKTKNKYAEQIKQNLEEIKTTKSTTFYSALQRILFYNQLLWQTGHRLNGLGRLDKILEPFYEEDLKNGKITKETAKELIKDFCAILHKYYWFKSNVLMGDTGQIIILGGKEENNLYFCNDLTYLFIEVMKELQIPDPKVLLRVSNNMPKDLMELSIKCVQTGIGCPLFSNDDVVIPKLIEFGYPEESVYDYVTAACWEPIMPEKTLDQTNITTINFLNPFHEMLEKEELNKIKTTEEILEIYTKYLKNYCDDIVKVLDKVKWQYDPLLSFMTEGCEKEDISCGTAKYNHYGVNSVGLASTVNSILNIESLVFNKKEFTLEELNNARKNNYYDKDINFVKMLKNQDKKYGKDDEQVIELTNYITNVANEQFSKYKNKFGGKIKFGLSSPGYISEAEKTDASLDGRKAKEPFAVHISSDDSQAYTELVQFASKLDYTGNRFNGNVVDFMVSPDFIENNFRKFVDFMMASIKVGFFQMQMNVVSSKMLIEARKNPDKFPNLIVRVWGFSAYFNDLPEEYKDVLIERALKNEGK